MEHSQWMRHYFVGIVFVIRMSSEFAAADVVVMSPQGKPRISLRSSTAQFGPALPDSGLIGYVVRSQPATACTPLSLLDVFRDVLEWWKPKILLIQQSDECAFEDQVHRAQASGYKAAIIFNAFSDELLVMPRHSSLNITIPAFFVGHADGVLLWEKYYSATEYYALLSPDQPKMGTALELSLILLPACIVIIPFLVAFILTMVSGRCPLTLMAFRHVHLKTRLIFQLPERKWDSDADPGREVSPCSICLEDFQKGEKVRTIPPCGHEFHSRCVDPWLLRDHLVCPLCRSEVNLDLSKLPRTSQSQPNSTQENPGMRQRIFTILPRWLPVRPRSTVPTAAVQESVV